MALMLFEEFSKLHSLLCEEMSTRQEFQKYIHKTLGHEYTYGGHGQVVHKGTKQVTHIMDGTGKAEKLAQPYEHDDRAWYEKNYATKFKPRKSDKDERRRASMDELLYDLPLHKRSKYASLFDNNEKDAIRDYSDASDEINTALQHGKYATPEEIEAHENLEKETQKLEDEMHKHVSDYWKLDDKIKLGKERGKDVSDLILQKKQKDKIAADLDKKVSKNYKSLEANSDRIDLGRQIKHLDSAFEKVEPPEHEKVYFRGLNNVELKKMKRGVKAGEKYHTATHMSTSTNPNVANSFSPGREGGLMIIHHPVNSKAKVMNMAHLGYHNSEHEHLISRNTEFHVIKVEPGNKNKPHKIHVRLT